MMNLVTWAKQVFDAAGDFVYEHLEYIIVVLITLTTMAVVYAIKTVLKCEPVLEWLERHGWISYDDESEGEER